MNQLPTLPSLPIDTYYDYGYAVGLSIWVIVLIVVISIGAAVGLAFIPATIARKKGYSYGGFWAFGFFLFVPALVVALVIEDKTQPRYQPPYPPYGQPYGQPPYGQPPYGQPPQPDSSKTEVRCPNCGAPVTGDGAFCVSCGTRVK